MNILMTMTKGGREGRKEKEEERWEKNEGGRMLVILPFTTLPCYM